MLEHLIRKCSLYFHTLRYLRAHQIYGRIWHMLHHPRVKAPQIIGNYKNEGRFIQQPFSRSFMTSPHGFTFLNREGRLDHPEAWNDPAMDQLWLYNLHYFHDLCAIGHEKRRDWHHDYITRWMDENPPFEGNGWLPYPLSLRIVNWIKWLLSGAVPPDGMLESLALQAEFLYHRFEWHLRGNHLFVNAKAMAMAGLFFGEGIGQSSVWLRESLELIRREIPEQVRPDGSNFEQSPMYHSIFLEDLLDLISCARFHGSDCFEFLVPVAEKMLGFLDGMTHPDGEISFFNDSAMGVAKRYSELFKYARNLDLIPRLAGELIGDDKCWVTHFRDSGFLRFKSPDTVMILDNGPIGPDYVPSHAHADALSVEMSHRGQRILVNSGTSVYKAGPERSAQRGTPAHNTLCVDGIDQSEVWSAFRVARRSFPTVSRVWMDSGCIHFIGGHNGYRRVTGLGEHLRQVSFMEKGIRFIDRMQGTGNHELQVRWHLHPKVIVETMDETTGCLLSHPGGRIRVRVAGTAIALEKSLWCPEFGLRIPNQTIVLKSQAFLPAEIRTYFEFID